MKPVSEKPARLLDPRIRQEPLEQQLPAFLDSLEQGWGPGYAPSGMVMVHAGNRLLFSRSLGFSNYGNAADNTAETPFLVGGLGQLFLALSTLRLVEQDKLSLSDPLDKFFPDCPAALANIPVSQWLAHRAGLPRATTAMVRASAEQSSEQQLAALWQRPLAFRPGSRRQVSNADHAVLVAIVEQASSQSYVELLKTEIVAPLGLSQTGLQTQDSRQATALRYSASPQDGQRQPMAEVVAGSLYASDLVQSSAQDLLRVVQALASNSLLTEQSLTLLRDTQQGEFSLAGRASTHRGLRVLRHGHGGRTAIGVQSQLTYVPELDLSIVVLSNSAPFNTQAAADAALKAALGETVKPLRKRRQVELDSEVAEHIRGAYLLNDDARAALQKKGVPSRAIVAMSMASIFLNKGQLFFKPARQGAMTMVPSGPSSFVLRGGKATLAFDIDFEHPDDTRLTLRQGKIAVEYERKPARQPKKVEHDSASPQ